LEAGRHFEVEYWLNPAKGEWIYVWERGLGIYEDDRLAFLEGFVTDITERKKAEEALRRARDRINYHVYNSPLAVIEWEKGRHITGWSPRAETMFGWKAEEVLGKNWGDFDFVHPEDWEYTQENIKKLFDGTTTFNKISNRNVCKDGTVLYCEWYNSALLDAAGRMESILSLVADVTEIKRAKEKAEAANRAKSEFLANMSHEIRTPLNGITGMLQLLSDSNPDAEQSEYVDMARKSTKRLNRLLTDILDLSRIEAGKLEIRRERFQPREVMQAIVDVFGHAVRENNNTLNKHIGENIPESLIGDETRLTQILFNLVGNACKYTENGRVEASVALLPMTRDNTRNLLFMVTDTGPGIPADKLQSVFETFTQAGESDSPFTRRYEGAGLGLTLVKRLVHLLKGTLCINTEKGEGTEVYVSIPFTVDNGPNLDGQ
jgi:PAS domain S-box-containing protein